MNFQEYLSVLAEDLNLIFKNESLSDSETQKKHFFRLHILIFHLHADFLMSEIIRLKADKTLLLSSNKNEFKSENMTFLEKLKLIYSLGVFDEDLFTTLRMLNTIRNNLQHNLLIELSPEVKRIKSLHVSEIINKEYLRTATPLEYLLYVLLSKLNLLAEYLHRDCLQETLTKTISVVLPRVGAAGNFPVIQVIDRPKISRVL